MKSIISSQAFCKTEEEFKTKMKHIVIEEEILKCNKIFVGCVLSGPLTIRQISEKDWHLRIKLDTSDKIFVCCVLSILHWNQIPDTLKKLFRWPGRDVIHCSITFGQEFHDLSESKNRDLNIDHL